MPAPINSGSGGSSQSAVVRGGTLRGLPVAPPAPQIVVGAAASVGIGVGHLWVKHAGVWKEPKLQVKHSGTWKEPTAAYVKTGGVWAQVYPQPVLGDPTLVLDLDFTAGTLDSKVTFTRATTATYVNASGLVASAAINAPRFDYDPSTLAARGLLIEEQRTNRLLYSSDLTNAAWSKGAGTTAIQDATGPDGVANSATSVSLNTGGPGVYQTITAGYPDAFSVYLRAKSGTPQVVLFISTTDLFTLNLSTTWQRFVVIGGGANPGIRVDYPTPLANVTIEIACAQLEALSYISSGATSYIPTTSAAGTRAADSAVMTGTNFSSWWNASEGTFVARYKKLTVAGDNVAVQVNDGTGNEDMEMMHIGANPHMFVYDSGATQTFTSVGTITALTTNKFAFAYKLNDLAACVNGGTVATDTSATIPTVDRLGLGINPSSGAFIMSGWYERLSYYNTRKSNAELITLTT